MTTKELIEILRDESNPNVLDYINDAADRLEALEGELAGERYRHDRYRDYTLSLEQKLEQLKDRHRWIPVTERLPVDWCPVLVTVREVEKPLVGSYRENVWFYEKWNTTFINGAVTHWMPLPEPPKEVPADA